MLNNCCIILVILNITVYFATAVKTCPEQYQTYENGNKCFSFLASRAQWITAEQACQQNDGKLAKIDNAFDEVFISSQALNFYATYSDTDVWIGLNNLMDSDTYQWTDGSNLTYQDWAKGQPLTQGPYCVSQTFKTGNSYAQYWSSESCFDFKFFVCEWNGNLTDPDSPPTTAAAPPTPTTILPSTAPTTTTTTTTTLKPTTPPTTTIQLTDAPITMIQTEIQTTILSEDTTTVIVNEETTSTDIPPSSPLCEYDFIFNYQDGRCYKVFDPLSIKDKDYEGGCHQYNGHLPSIHNVDTNNFIVDLVGKQNMGAKIVFRGKGHSAANSPSNLTDPNSFGIAIGLQLIKNEWQWTDGTPSNDFHYWIGGPTDGTNCSVIIVDKKEPDNHHWESINCIQRVFAYVCYNLPLKDHY